MGRVARGWGLVALVAVGAACVADAPEAARPSTQRTDSAGTAVVTTRGPDRPLAWRAEEVLRIGPADEGPESFFRMAASGLASDAEGNVYVLDTGHGEVRVFAQDGRHLHTLGRPGEGPGELERPSRLFVADSGLVVVADNGKRAFVRWAPDGSLLAQITVRDRSLSPYDLRGRAAGGLVVTDDEPYATFEDALARNPTTRRLLHIPLDLGSAGPAEPGEPRELARWLDAPTPSFRIEECDSNVSFTPPLSPSEVLDVAADGVAWATGPEYAVAVVEPGGARRSIRRALPPVAATPELAARDFRPISIELATHEMCEIDGERAVEAAGHPAVVPWITDLRVAPGGRLFVERRDPAALPARRIDVFAPDGAYEGTLPDAFPMPDAFHGTDTFLRIERDALDVPAVVLYRIGRSPTLPSP